MISATRLQLLRMCCKTRLFLSPTFDFELRRGFVHRLCGSTLRHGAYAGQTPAPVGGAQWMILASRRRFCAVAVSNTSSRTPLKPRNRRRSSLRMRFMWANLISTFLRSRCDCLKASVFARARTRSRISSSMSRETLRAFAVVHCGLSLHLAPSYVRARYGSPRPPSMMPLWVSNLPAGQTYTLRRRSKRKSARLNLPSTRAELSHTGTCGVIARSVNHLSSLAAP